MDMRSVSAAAGAGAGHASATAAAPGDAATGARPRRGRPWPDWALVAPPVVTLAVMLWGLTATPYWGDEADTVSAESRSLPQLAHMLGHVDAVHGLYYLMLWPIVQLTGPAEFATRLPSAIAMAGAALGVTVVGRRLRSRRAGLAAGLVFAVLPVVTSQGHNARPYAMVTAVAVLASWLLMLAADDPRPWRFAVYGLSLVVLGYLELLALVIVAAHAVTLIAVYRRTWRTRLAVPGLITVAATAVLTAPVVIWGWLQRHQIAWIRGPNWGDIGYLLEWLALGSVVSTVLFALLAIAGARRQDAPGRTVARPGPRAGRAGRELTWLAVPWVVVPPLLLIAASQIRPVYNFRYVTFCLPAVALLAGAGLAALGWLLRAAVLALIVGLAVPTQLVLRVPGSGMRGAAQVLAAYERPGDAVVYPGGGIPPWYMAYPAGFAKLRDIGMKRSGPASGRLYGLSVPLAVLRQRELSTRRIWVVEMRADWQNPAAYLAPGFRLVREWRPGGGLAMLALYQRSPAAGR